MSEETIRLRTTSGADEVNARGVSYKVSPYGTVCVPSEDVPPLLHVGGFHAAAPNDKNAVYATIEQVFETAWHLPPSRERSTLLAVLQSPNSLAHLVQSISFS